MIDRYNNMTPEQKKQVRIAFAACSEITDAITEEVLRKVGVGQDPQPAPQARKPPINWQAVLVRSAQGEQAKPEQLLIPCSRQPCCREMQPAV